MGLILDISPRTLERVLYFASYIVLDKGRQTFSKQILSEAEYQEEKKNGEAKHSAVWGARQFRNCCTIVDLEKEYAELQAGLVNATGQKRARIVNVWRL